MSIPKKTRQAALISGASIILAGIMLLSLRVLHPSWLSDQLDALLFSLAFSVGACFLLFLRRLGQAHLALGMYLIPSSPKIPKPSRCWISNIYSASSACYR